MARDPWVVGLVLCGLILNVAWLGRACLQIDEIVTIRDAISQPSVAAIYSTELERFHWYRVLPLFMVPIHWISRFFPAGSFPPEWALRLPGAVFCAFSLPVFYGLGNALGGRTLGRVAMALTVFSPFHLYYAREAYAYGYLMAFSAGVLWASVLLLEHDWSGRTPWKALVGFTVSATLMLQTHLTGLVFLSVWLLVLACALISQLGLVGALRPRVLMPMLACVLVPYLCFSPFLVRLLTTGYSSTDPEGSASFSLAAIKPIVGLMGWGETWWCLLPFVASILAGANSCLKNGSRRSMTGVVALLSQVLAYIAFQGTYQRLTGSRFEVRYFCSIFPILTVFSAAGLLLLWRRRPWAVCESLQAPSIPPAVAGGLTAMLMAWLLVGDGLVISLRCRGHNYRAMAQWINEHVSEGGIYAYDNVWDLRGVPGVYPTPGRVATAVAAWTTLMDVDEVRLPDRVRSMFLRFPEIMFVEVAPPDLLDPGKRASPIDRENLFMRQEWLGDATTDWLFTLGLHPLSEMIWSNRMLHRTLFSYNLPEDLPALARKRGQVLYHSIGHGWNYVNDEGYNHWMVTQGPAEVIAGNASSEDVAATLAFTFLPQPPGCRVRIFAASGEQLGTFELIPDPKSITIQTHRVTSQNLAPGDHRYRVTVEGLESGSNQPTAVLRAFEVEAAVP